MTVTGPNLEYWDWVGAEAKAILADGCTGVADIRRVCCDEHDLGYYHGRDPRDAYRLARSAHPSPWTEAAKLSRAEVDGRFKSCNQSMDSVDKPDRWYEKPLWGVRWAGRRAFGFWRYVGVRIGGGDIWDRHRSVRP